MISEKIKQKQIKRKSQRMTTMKKQIKDITIGEWKTICQKYPYGICRDCPFFKLSACPSLYFKPSFDAKLEKEIEVEENGRN